MEGFHEGQKVWVAQSDGSQRSGIFVSDAELPGWFGGPPAAYVVYPDTRSARPRCRRPSRRHRAPRTPDV
jgi:hypothetical protein